MLERLPAVARERQYAIAHEMIGHTDDVIPGEVAAQIAAGVLGACIVVALVERGFTLHAPLAEAVTVHRGDLSVAPFRAPPDFADPGRDRSWVELLGSAGLTGMTFTASPAA